VEKDGGGLGIHGGNITNESKEIYENIIQGNQTDSNIILGRRLEFDTGKKFRDTTIPSYFVSQAQVDNASTRDDEAINILNSIINTNSLTKFNNSKSFEYIVAASPSVGNPNHFA
jgi:hypothetical protein